MGRIGEARNGIVVTEEMTNDERINFEARNPNDETQRGKSQVMVSHHGIDLRSITAGGGCAT